MNCFTDRTLRNTLMCHKMAQHLALPQNNETCFSPHLTELFQNKIYISKGYDYLRDSIKGYAVLGYLWKIIQDRFDELRKISDKELRKAKRAFFKARKINVADLSEKDYDSLTLFDICLWEKLKDRPCIIATSGSFGIAALQILKILRDKKIKIRQQNYSLLTDKEGSMVIFSPAPESGLISADKAAVIKNLIASLPRCKVIHFSKFEGTARDKMAFTMALMRGGYLFLTNPQSQAEIQGYVDVVKQKLALLFPIYGAIAKESLRSIDVEVSLFSAKATRNLTCAIDGLAIIRLQQLENVLNQHPETEKIVTYNQPSVGATLAALVRIDETLQAAIMDSETLDDEVRNLLRESFQKIFERVFDRRKLPKLEIKAAFDVANRGLADYYHAKYQHYPHNANPVNGLGTITPGQGCIEVIDAHLKSVKPSFCGGEDFYIVPHNFMNIAQALIFAANYSQNLQTARIPEMSGAAGLGGLMYKHFLSGEIKAQRYADFLTSHGINSEIFFTIVNKDYFDAESQTHGGEILKFSEDFVTALAAGISSANFDSRTSNTILIITNTGSNGTELIEHTLFEYRF